MRSLDGSNLKSRLHSCSFTAFLRCQTTSIKGLQHVCHVGLIHTCSCIHCRSRTKQSMHQLRALFNCFGRYLYCVATEDLKVTVGTWHEQLWGCQSSPVDLFSTWWYNTALELKDCAFGPKSIQKDYLIPQHDQDDPAQNAGVAAICHHLKPSGPEVIVMTTEGWKQRTSRMTCTWLHGRTVRRLRSKVEQKEAYCEVERCIAFAILYQGSCAALYQQTTNLWFGLKYCLRAKLPSTSDLRPEARQGSPVQ